MLVDEYKSCCSGTVDEQFEFILEDANEALDEPDELVELLPGRCCWYENDLSACHRVLTLIKKLAFWTSGFV